jgi:hypothetical protein
MTNDEMQRAMEFIVQQQAQTSAKLDALTETQRRGEEKWAKTEDGIRALLAIAEIHEREISAVGQQIQELGETTRNTDERLNTLINVVERHISKGRNGHS